RPPRTLSPTTDGTVIRRGPRLTQTRMLRWLLSVEPAGGSWATTRSAGTFGSCRRPSTRNSRRWRAASGPASGTRLPTTEGTTTSWDVSTTRMVVTADNAAVT